MKTKTKNFNTSAKYYDFIYTKKNYKKETNFILKFFNQNIKQTKILDLGTGTGSHLVHLISKGYKVDGVEISPMMIKLARDKLKKKKINKNFKLYNQDIIKFKGKPNHYNVALSLFHVINYIKNLKSLKLFFRNISRNLCDKGIFIFDCWNKDLVNKKKLKDTKKVFYFKNYKLVREGVVTLSKKSIVNINYVFKIYKNNKIIDIFREKHTLCAFNKTQIFKAANKDFKLIKNCIWFNKNKAPNDNDFSSLFIFRKKTLKL